MKKKRLISLSMALLLTLGGSLVSAESNPTVSKKELYEKLGFEQSYVESLKAQPNSKVSSSDSSSMLLSNKDRLKAIEFGYNEQEIADFTETEVDYLRDKNPDLISVEENFYRVSGEDEAEIIPESVALSEVAKFEASQNLITPNATSVGSDTEQLSWMKMTTTVTKDTSYSPTRYYIKNSFEWLSEPFWNLTDAIGISHPEHMSQVQNSELFKYTYDIHHKTIPQNYFDTKDVFKYTADDKNSNGMAFKYNILRTHFQNGTEFIVKKNRGYMAFGTTRASSSYTTGTAYGAYSHTEVLITGSLGVKISLNNLSLSGATKVTKMTDTGVTFSF